MVLVQKELQNAYIGEYTSRLPSAYQEVEYIQNSGTQYIKTGLQIKDGYRFVGDVMILNSESREGGNITGGYIGYQSGTYYRLYIGGGYGSGWSYGYLQYYGNGSLGTCNKNTKYSLDFSWISGNAYVKVNGSTLVSWSNTYSTSLSAECPLMCSYDGGNRNASPGMRVYSAKYYNASGTLVREFVPCYRKQDTVIGMYDLVNGTFYTNAGSGTFTKGGDV